MNVTLDIPDELARALDDPPGSLHVKARDALVIEAYRAKRLSRGQAGKLLGLSFYQTEQWFDDRGVQRSYSQADLDTDRQNLKGIPRR
jgi:predicted HTH domain antitoxin